MLTSLEAKILDKNSECLGTSVENLMENAGKALAKAVDEFSIGKILFICGSGNNGGDGYAASKYLRSSADYCSFREPKSKLCKRMRDRVHIAPYFPDILDRYDTIVDCVLGTGMEGELRPEYAELILYLNTLGKRVISCDVPSGFGTDTVLKADVTITFHDMKEGMSKENCGEILIADIGIPKGAETCVNRGDFLRYPIPKKDSHKGQNGRLIIVGGGPYIGAPICSAMAALRVGTDLVTVFTPRRSFIPIASYSPSYIVKELSSDFLCMEDVLTIIDASESADTLLIGPGLGLEPQTKDAIRFIVENTKNPIVIDADAITAVSGWIRGTERMVFTPHRKELSRLIGKDMPDDMDIHRFCMDGTTILCKGNIDKIYSKNRLRENHSGSPGMTVGGTGDVLAGAVAGLVAKGMSCFDAACLGAHICGLAGKKAFDEHSYGMTAEDVISHIGQVLKEGLE